MQNSVGCGIWLQDCSSVRARMRGGPRLLGPSAVALVGAGACYLWFEALTGSGLVAVLMAWLMLNMLSLGLLALLGLRTGNGHQRPRNSSFAC